MPYLNESEIAAEIMRRFKGRVALACAAALGLGFVAGAILF